MKTTTPDTSSPSLENLIEAFDLGEEVLHPGGLNTTRELAELCDVRKDSRGAKVPCPTVANSRFVETKRMSPPPTKPRPNKARMTRTIGIDCQRPNVSVPLT
jgi:hypothetical protein